MKLKKYYADTMQDALKTIKDEIGPDAMILSSKIVRSKKGFLGLFSKKQIEVVASYDEKPKKEEEKQRVAEIRRYAPYPPETDAAGFGPMLSAQGYGVQGYGAPVAPGGGPNERDIAEQQKKIENLDESIGELKALINHLSSRVENYGEGTEKKLSLPVRALFDQLLENDVQRALATEMCVRTEQIVAGREADPKEVLRSLLLDMLGTARPIQYTKFKRKVVMLIGPTGVGKTTTLVKLASKMLYEDKLDIGVINADVFRVAAQEHLKAYCDILRTDMITIYRPEEIVDALEAFKSKDIVFIDTAGKLSSNPEYQKEIGSILKLGGVDDIYLLVCASTSEKVIRNILKNYSFLNVYNVIVTKVDETPTKGMVLYIAKESGRPLSYVTTGQNVPDDIAEISPKEIVASILEN